MKSRQVMTREQAQRMADILVDLPLPFTIHVTEGVIRTNPQNDTMWKWNTEIARHRGDMTPQEVHRENKLIIGCPILMRDDAFRAFVQQLSGLTHEQKLDAMDYIGVTSRMSKKEMSEYMDTLYRKWTARGVKLTDPGAQPYENEVMD